MTKIADVATSNNSINPRPKVKKNEDGGRIIPYRVVGSWDEYSVTPGLPLAGSPLGPLGCPVYVYTIYTVI